MPYPETGEGFQVDSSDTWTTFHKREFKLKPFEDYDCDIRVDACGICGSDVLTISGGWGDQKFPLCVGHEIIGTVLRVGPKVTLIKPGQRVGVGAQSFACLTCRQCKSDNETYCKHQLGTYGDEWPGTGGIVSQGGYSSHVRTHEHWVFPIPDALDTALAAPMLCAGLTAYSPLVRHGCGPGKKVGILGLGGIGHFGVLFAKALGAEVWVLSRSRGKEADAKALGADGFIATGGGGGGSAGKGGEGGEGEGGKQGGEEEEDWAAPHEMTFDLILSTASSNAGWNMRRYLSLLDVHARWVNVGVPHDPMPVAQDDLFPNGAFVGASHLGSRRETIDMLRLAADRGIKSWVQEVKIGEESLSEAVQRLQGNDVRYRFTLTGYDEAFPNRG